MCDFPGCRNATAGTAPMCSLHATVRIHPSYVEDHRDRRDRHRTNHESEED